MSCAPRSEPFTVAMFTFSFFRCCLISVSALLTLFFLLNNVALNINHELPHSGSKSNFGKFGCDPVQRKFIEFGKFQCNPVQREVQVDAMKGLRLIRLGCSEPIKILPFLRSHWLKTEKKLTFLDIGANKGLNLALADTQWLSGFWLYLSSEGYSIAKWSETFTRNQRLSPRTLGDFLKNQYPPGMKLCGACRDCKQPSQDLHKYASWDPQSM